MKSKCSFILKASTALVLALLMLFGTVSTSLAAVVDKADIGAEADLAKTGYTSLANTRLYFDNSKTKWSSVAVYVGHGTWTTSYAMTNTGYSDIWYVSFGNDVVWDGRTKLFFAGNNYASSGNSSSIDTVHGWTFQNGFTGLITANNADGGSCFFPANANNNMSLTRHAVRVVAGDIASNGWDDCTDIMTYSSSQWTKTYTNVAAGDYSLAVVGFYNNWSPSYRWAAKGTLSGTGASWADANDRDHNIKLSLTYASNVTVTLTSANKVNISVSAKAHNVTRTAPTNGSLQLSKTSASSGFGTSDLTVAEGANYWVKATANSGYEIDTLTVGGSTITAATGQTTYTYKGTMGTSNVATSVTFKAATTPSIDTFTIGGGSSKTLNIGGTAALASTTSNAGGATVTYSSSNTSVATVSGSGASGTVTAVSNGTATITASMTVSGTTYTKTVTVTVNKPTITVGNKTGLKIGETYTPSPTLSNPSSGTTGWSVVYSRTSGTYSTTNGTTITGDTYNSNATTFKASYQYNGDEKASTTFTVKTADPTISMTSTAQSVNVGATYKRTATGGNIGSGATGAVTYSSGTPAVATVASDGTVTALTPGSTVITATYTVKIGSTVKATKTATYTVNVPTPTITASVITVAKGNSKSISASTSNPSGLTLSYALKSAVSGVSISGNTVSVTQGCTASSATVTVSAKNSAGTVVATKDVTVTIQAPSLDVKDGSTGVKNGTVYTTKGTNKTLTVAPNFTDDLTVKSSNTSIATVSLSGNTLTITPKAKGTCKVSVSTDSGYAPTAAIFPGASVFADKFDLAGVGAVATQTATFTVNVAEADTYKYVYFTNGVGFTTPKIYLFGGNDTNASFPGESMVKIGKNEENKDVYAIRYPATKDYTKAIICNSADNNKRVQLSGSTDLTLSSSQNAFWCNTANSDSGAGRWNCTIEKPQITAPNVTIDMGSTKTMTATVLTSGTPSTYNWSSGTTSVATTANTHTASNVITGVAPGTSTITIKAYAEKPTGWTSIVTNGTADDFVAGTTTATATVVAENKTITYQSKYSDNGTTWNNATNTQGTFTVKNGSTNVNSGASLPYNTTLTLTATPANGYAVEGVYRSIDNGFTWTKVDCTVSGGVYTNNAFKLNNNYLLKARFIKVYKLSAFDSYEMKNNQVTFVTAPPKSITIKHTDAHGDATTYTYSYDGTVAAGNPYSPDGTNPAALPIASGKYGQGNYIQYYAGDEITMTYSAMASSELLKGVFYNNDTEYYINKPTTTQYKPHDYTAAHTLYMNSSYYDSVPGSFDGVTVDQDSHSIKFTGTQDYKNIDVEIGTKRKVYFSDYTNAVITSKNVDDYYYDNEPLSVTGDQLKVAAKQSATQTNSIDATKVRYYKANADGTKGTELTAAEKTALMLTIVGSSSTSSASADGAALIFNGNMPAYDLYIDLNMENSYTIKLGTKIVSDLGGTATRLASKATVKINTLSAVSNADVTTSSTSVTTGTTAALSVTGLTSGYMFVGWYWGDASGPDYNKGFISDKTTLSYAPKKGGIIWAVGTKDLFINGSKYITGKDTDWYAEGNTQKNLEMKFEASTGRYYWEITDTMFAAAGSDFKTWGNQAWGTATTAYGTYNKGDNGSYYWTASEDKYHGKSYFQFLDSETGNDNKSIWNQLTSFTVDTPANGPTYGKIYPTNATDSEGTWSGQGFINFNESGYPGYSSPLRIYYDPNASGNAKLTVEATPIHSNLYVSNGYNVGSTLKTYDVTVQPVVDGVVKTSGQTGYFNVKSEGSGWNPDAEGHVQLYIPQKKGATVRITKQAGGSDKIAAFLIYDIDNRTVRAERNLTKGTTVSNKTPYYFDLTLANERQNLYIVPIVEEAGAKVTITFDATQLNRAQWGDIVTAYTWYTGTNNNGLGAYPGQPMIPSDDMSTWTTTFAATKGGNELTGITFTNYVDGIHSWLGCSGVMGEVSDHKTGTATGGIINVYNHVDSGTNGEYSRTNYKAQTYDYHEPIALYNRYKNEDSVNITFQMKDGNSSLISWRHTEFAPENIISGTWGHTLNWEYLTNAKGDQYIDMNGNPLGANNKPTATFYVASKGQVVYNDSRMDYVFHGGHNYQMKGYDAAYSDPTGGANRGSYTRTALPSGQWSSDITYGGAADLDMKYAVQWYVYDAQGNYITTVLSAGIADLSSNNTDTYIAKQLEDLGYAVDGKSVAICYDKPRYMYGDWTVTNSAQNINSGPNFDAYRFEGQWIAAAQTDTVKVHVGVGMMTDSGEVLADSNTAAYGNASASLVSGVNFGKPNYAITANDGSWAQTAASDAKLNGIALNASATNFIGWYYYDANTGEFTKATYASNEGFRPNYTNKDVTYYAIYRAAAVYNYIYQGREGERIYSAAGEDLKDAEMVDNKVIYANHSEDILAKLPVGIGIFKKNIDFSAANVASWTQDNNTQYIFKLSGFRVTSPEYTLTAHYKDASGQLQTTTKTSVYNGGAVNLTTLNGGTAVTTLYDKKFLGWYAYDNGEKGDLLSTQANYGLQLTRDQAVIAVYEEDNNTLPTDGWSVHIDENEVNKELTTKDTGVFYNDTIVRVRKSSDVKAELPTGAKIGVLVVCDNKTGNAINGYSDGNLNTLVKAVASGKTMKTSSGLSITNMQASSQTSFNRTDIAVRADYAKNLGAKYCVYAYFFDGSAYHFSAVSDVKTYV